MAAPTLLLQLAEFAHRYGDASRLPDEVRLSVRERTLDILGICIAASELDTSVAVREYVTHQGGNPEASAIGVDHFLPAPLAALLNGTLAHSLDYDDTHLPSVLHPSASVIPSALAACQQHGGTGARFVGAAAEPMAIAASMASGIIEANRTGGTVKRIHCGWAAHAAVTAVSLARAGLTGPPTVLEGRFGFFQAFLSGDFNREALVAGLGEQWSVPGIFFKPYPANHFTHAGIDAAIALRRRGLSPEEVRELHLGVAAPTVPTIGEPIEVKRTPETGYQAQFSGPYTVVAGLLGGSGLGVGLDDFTDALARDPRRRALMAKVSVHADPRCSEIFPRQFPAILRARTTGGHELEEAVVANRGGPERPLTELEVTMKFKDNARRHCDEGAIERLVAEVEAVERCDDVGRCLAPVSVGD
jgi:2-methylcitrate dehydratase PrpD